MKTHKGTAKRIKLTSTGKLTRRRAFGNHMLSKKSKSRKRNINISAIIKGGIAKNVSLDRKSVV